MTLVKCCFCVDLRKGCIAIAILGLLGSITITTTTLSLAMLIPAGLSLFLAIIANGSLLHGAITKTKITTLIYLVLEAISIFCLILGFCLYAAFQASAIALCYGDDDLFVLTDGSDPCIAGGIWLIVTLVPVGIMVVLSLYFWVCVYSFLKVLQGASRSNGIIHNMHDYTAVH